MQVPLLKSGKQEMTSFYCKVFAKTSKAGPLIGFLDLLMLVQMQLHGGLGCITVILKFLISFFVFLPPSILKVISVEKVLSLPGP